VLIESAKEASKRSITLRQYILYSHYQSGVTYRRLSELWSSNRPPEYIEFKGGYQEFIIKHRLGGTNETKHTIPMKIRFATVVELSNYYVLRSGIEWEYFKRNLTTDARAGSMRAEAREFAVSVKMMLTNGGTLSAVKGIVDMTEGDDSDDEGTNNNNNNNIEEDLSKTSDSEEEKKADKEYAITSILGKRGSGDDALYQVKWENGKTSWEELYGLSQGCPQLVKDYEISIAIKKKCTKEAESSDSEESEEEKQEEHGAEADNKDESTHEVEYSVLDRRTEADGSLSYYLDAKNGKPEWFPESKLGPIALLLDQYEEKIANDTNTNN